VRGDSHRSYVLGRYALVLALLFGAEASAQCVEPRNGWVLLAYVPPLASVDGTPISQNPIVRYAVQWGRQPGAYTASRDFPGTASEFCVEGLDPTGSWYFAATAFNDQVGSNPSNVACYTFSGAQCLPGPFESDVTAVAFRDSSVTSWSKGFDFRGTAAYVTDPAGSVYVIGDRYPTTRCGCGWESFVTGSVRDRSRTVPTLAGLNFQPSNSTQSESVFRVDLPGPGRYRVRLAAGDQGYPNHAFFEIRDGNTVLRAQPDTAVGTGQYIDATGVMRASAATWASSNAPLERDFATSILRIALKRAPGGSASVLAHLSVERVP
jgi:hypothetical protein